MNAQRFTRRRVLGTLAVLTATRPAFAQAPLRLLVGYPPGGPADTAARIVSDRLSRLLGQPVVIDNRPGAGGQIAAQALKAAPADGSVLMLSNTHTVAMVPLTVKSPGFAPAVDFRTVGTVADFELALAVHPKTGARTLAELREWFVRHTAEASIGVPAPASAPEFVAQQISRSFRVDTVPVAYRGAAPMVQDLLGGQLAAGLSGISDFLPYHESGRLRIVAVTRTTALLPRVPSLAEAGLPGLEATDFLALYAPAATPDAAVERWNAALQRVLAMPEVAERLRGHAMTVAPATPAAHAQRLAQASRMLAGLLRDSGQPLP